MLIDLVLGLYVFSLLFLTLYGVHRFWILWLYFKYHRFGSQKIYFFNQPNQQFTLPSVTIQIPVYNERYVAERIIDSVIKIRYPQHLLQIQILDDSTDDTQSIVSTKVEELRRNGHPITHLHRDNRKGFKAGALAEGLKATSSELIAIFDADFLPGIDFLEKTVPFFHLEHGNGSNAMGRYSFTKMFTLSRVFKPCC